MSICLISSIFLLVMQSFFVDWFSADRKIRVVKDQVRENELHTRGWNYPTPPRRGDSGAASRDDAVFSGESLLQERESPWAITLTEPVPEAFQFLSVLDVNFPSTCCPWVSEDVVEQKTDWSNVQFRYFFQQTSHLPIAFPSFYERKQKKFRHDFRFKLLISFWIYTIFETLICYTYSIIT